MKELQRLYVKVLTEKYNNKKLYIKYGIVNLNKKYN